MYIKVIDDKTKETLGVLCGRNVSVFISENKTVYLDYNNEKRFAFEYVSHSHTNYKVSSDEMTIYVNKLKEDLDDQI